MLIDGCFIDKVLYEVHCSPMKCLLVGIIIVIATISIIIDTITALCVPAMETEQILSAREAHMEARGMLN